ncbi:hypothetical protein AXF42_Ash019459 [Apostasia shenzhenica]|uniref:Uncharacterized protein n=1 Tax=Apostasia shenzhenica TaxID=1088818 RepID=A0A2I0AYG1_9ASPA|nr:hypothetical protein AXF42_Ash019459 [Apostasia shenzhenica]
MPPPTLFPSPQPRDLSSVPPPAPATAPMASDACSDGYTAKEREIADIIINLLYYDSGSRRSRQSAFVFPRWKTKKKRSPPAPPPRPPPCHLPQNCNDCFRQFGGDVGENSSASSPNTPLTSFFCLACDKENESGPAPPVKTLKGANYGHMEEVRSGHGDRSLRTAPPAGMCGCGDNDDRVFLVPDLNVLAEELVVAAAPAAEGEMRRRRMQEAYEMASRRMAAAEARRRRRELRRPKSSLPRAAAMPSA